MAKTLYPGVEIPDVVDRAHPIAAVETGIPVFVGLGRSEDNGGVGEPVRSFAEFEKRFGMPRYRLSEAVRLFFDNGGLQCYVSAVPGDKPSHEGLRAGLAAAKDIAEADLVVVPDAALVRADAYGALMQDVLKDCARTRRFAVLEAREGADFGTAWRSWGAAYAMPGGKAAGLIAAEDAIHGPWKAPAELPNGTLAREGEWKYVTVRRLSIFIERSLERGLDWVAHEPRNADLFSLVRGVVKHFLLDLWRKGALVGPEPESAFFLRCDGTTLGLEDLDDGDFIIEVSFAPIKPKEFVVLRIVQKAAA